MIHVMIVDDESISQNYIRSLLPWENEGYKLYPPVYNGKEARKILSNSPMDIVLLDVFMPGENGVELSRYIMEHFPGVTIIAISSHDDYDYVREIMKNGARDYILKHRLNEESLRDALRLVNSGTIITNQLERLPEPFPGNNLHGPGITLSVSRRKILSRLIKEANRAGPEFLIRQVFNSIDEKDQSAKLITVNDIKEIFKEIFYEFTEEKGILPGFNSLTGWAKEHSLKECEKKIIELFRQLMDEAEGLINLNPYVLRGRNFMLDHYNGDINLNITAEALYISPSYLSRLYKKETGISFVDALNGIRIDAAKACLLERMNLKSTAALCGFDYYNYFIKVFKDHTGLNPTDYT